MKHPFWIVNSLLLFLLFSTMGITYFLSSPLPEVEHTTLLPSSIPTIKESVHVNIAAIYENDLFDTYTKKEPAAEISTVIEPLPEPPQPQPLSIPELPEPQFLEPINITLKGIITVSSDNSKNRTIIEDNKTKQEAVYRVGDTIEDARIIRILSNKIILLRPNGQQEVLYLRIQDAKNDPAYALIDGWDTVITKKSETAYTIDAHQFINRISNLGQVIDLLGLTTAYDKGVSIGCRIGQLDEKSFGPLIGLQKGDIILTVNNIPATTTENRLSIYQHILALSEGQAITLNIIRNQIPETIQYTLTTKHDTLHDTSHSALNSIHPHQSHSSNEEALEEKKREQLKKRYSLAPTIKEIRTKERKHMFEKGRQQKLSPTRAQE